MKTANALRYVAPPAAVALGLALNGCSSSNQPTPHESTSPVTACAPEWVQNIGKRILALPNMWHGSNSNTQGTTITDRDGKVTISVESAPPTHTSSLGSAVNLCLIDQIIISGIDAQGTFYASLYESNDYDSDDNRAWQPSFGGASCVDQAGRGSSGLGVGNFPSGENNNPLSVTQHAIDAALKAAEMPHPSVESIIGVNCQS